MEIKFIIVALMLLAGAFFIMVAAFGILRFPDFYSRMHPAGKTDTLGQAIIFSALMIHEGFTMVSLKLLIIIVFVFVANPTATHALASSAFSVELRPWQKLAKDEGEKEGEGEAK
ncbi:MAG: monovalent cation/H(+) antiporter subunit G [Thermodesulfobacteriota bacterium]